MPDYVAKLNKEIDRKIERALSRMRSSSLAQSSIENGSVPEYDADGVLMSQIGAQYDDTHAPTVYAGPTPPIPAGVSVAAGPASIKVAWDGTFVDALVAPLDWSAFEVHASPDADFVPDPLPNSSTRVGTIGQAAGGSLTFQPATGSVFVRCVSRSVAGKYSDPTDAVDAYADSSGAQIGSGGEASFTSLASAGDITIGGVPLLGQTLDPASPVGILDSFSQGCPAVVDFKPLVNGITVIDNSNFEVGQFTALMRPGRVYQFLMPWRAYVTASSGQTKVNITAWLFARFGDDAITEPPDPTTSDIPVGHQSQTFESGGTGINDSFTIPVFTPPRADGATVQVKFLLVLWARYGNFSPDITAVPSVPIWMGTLTDQGIKPDTIAASAPGAATTQTITTTWAASDSHGWGNDGARLDTGIGGQPAPGSLLWQNGTPGTLAHSAVVFNGAGIIGESKTVPAALAGKTLIRAELFLYQTWAASDDQPQVQVRAWTGTTLPATKTPPSVASPTIHYYTARSQPAWFDIPTSYISPTQTGIWIASPNWGFPNAHTNLAGATHATPGWRPMLRLTYR